MFALLALVATALVVLALPLILLRLAFKLVFAVVFLPLKLLGAIFGLVFGLVGLVARVLFSVAGLVFGLLAAVAVLVVIPLLPFVLLGLGIWIAVRASNRPRRAYSVA